MASPRKNAPALYELIGRQPAKPAGFGEPSPRPEPEPPRDDRDDHPSNLGPGRTVRMPVGFFFIGVAAVIAAGIGGYALGYMKKEREVGAEERRQAEAEAALLREPTSRSVNPDILRSPPIDRSSRPTQEPQRPATQPQPEGQPAAPTLIVVGDGVGDPRTRGVNYAILATLGPAQAEELGEFLAGRGVEVAVVAGHNRRLRSVVSLRGFPSGEFRSEERLTHERLLKDLGEEWSRSGQGRKPFSDLFWDRHD